ncbi:MAG: sn-glycerol-1-phosphate dehydrogenase [Anaerolineales bacterium]|nr:sn-glycerol-1-phosphate dehydrogenase [Anaerolineales bacterium]
MKQSIPVYIGKNAIAELIAYCKLNGLDKFVLVADQNTYAAMGKSVEDALKAAQFDVIVVVLSGDEVIADERYVVQVLTQVDRADRMYLAIGGGTLTDISRFVSHRTRNNFIALPTAPSVDGFTSLGAPLVVAELKQTFICHAPSALFADLGTLCAAPQRLIAAGFGDMIGKILSVSDWKLGHVLGDEPYDEQIAQQFLTAAQASAADARAIGARAEEGVRTLIAGLIESGFGMLDFGNSAPASGAEHHMSHFWEMKLLRERRPAILHGAKVGLASILTAQRYQTIKQLSREQVAKQMQWSRLPPREQQICDIRRAYGSIAEEIIKAHHPFLDLNEQRFDLLRQRIVARWDQVQAIASQVPAPQQLIDWLELVDGPVDGGGIGLSNSEIALALEFSHYLRNRFTINKLWFMLDLPPASTRGN